MKKIYLIILLMGVCAMQSSAQGTMQLTAGANIRTTNNAFIVLDNMHVVNNGSFVQAVGDGTTKFTGNTNTTTSGSGTTTLDKLEVAVNNGFTHTLAKTVSLKNVLTLTTGQLVSNGFLILKSDASHTARVAPVTSMVPEPAMGNVTVERFISAAFARSSWRLITAPLKSISGVNGTIFEHWQNNGANTPAGIDTRVTGPVNNGGLDAYTPGPSMKWWDVVNQTLQPVTTTNNPAITPLFTIAPSAANQSYFTFIDGDRTAVFGAPTTTTLTAAGSLQTGDQTFTTTTIPDGFNMIGNPYASPVDLNKLRADNVATSNTKTAYYYWDPYLTGDWGYGAYVTVSYDAAGAETIMPPAANHTRFLQSGQAMFVQTNTTGTGSPTLVFRESQKDPTNINTIFRTTTGQVESIGVNLNVVGSNTPTLVDGVVTNLDNSYSAAIDNYDAYKIYNTGESVAFMRNGKALTIERRPMVKSDDVLYLNLTNLKPLRNYQFEFTPVLNPTFLQAFLVDNYLKTTTPVDLNKSSTANFTINTDAASTGANRFSIVFAKPAIVSAGKPLMSIYPNPVTNGTINLQMNNMPQGIYKVRVFNSLGQTILTRQINHAQGTETIKLGKTITKGEYTIEVIKPDNSKFSSKVIAY